MQNCDINNVLHITSVSANYCKLYKIQYKTLVLFRALKIVDNTGIVQVK